MILLAFLAIAVVGGTAVLASGRTVPGLRSGAVPDVSGDGPESGGPGASAALAEPDPRLPPVLLPDHPVAADIADLRFSVALRGYRMDEVDEVLERLAAALLERDAALAELRGPDACTGGAAAPEPCRPASDEHRPESPE